MTQRIVALVALLVAFLVVASPQLASACAVCMSGRDDETRVAFIATTAFMTFLPLVVIGGVVWWLRRRFLAMQAPEDRGRLSSTDRRIPSDAPPVAPTA